MQALASLVLHGQQEAQKAKKTAQSSTRRANQSSRLPDNYQESKSSEKLAQFHFE